MRDIVFLHGEFQNHSSWAKWVGFFGVYGNPCKTPAWPFHSGDCAALRAKVPPGLGALRLKDVVDHLQPIIARLDKPIMIGHSVGGLLTQIFLNQGLLSCGIAIDSVPPNRMLGSDWPFLKNTPVIANLTKDDDPVRIDPRTFHQTFANTLDEQTSDVAFQNYVNYESRNVLRDCLGDTGMIDLAAPHAPLLIIGGEKDQIIPEALSAKNAKAYTNAGSVTSYRAFPGRSHYICNEPGWNEIAKFVANWIAEHAPEAK